jgi:crossover junction endodeoxyribonuclease RuvC
MRTILGLDPGLARIGYGLVGIEGSRYRHVAHGAIRTSAGTAVGARLQTIYEEIGRLVAAHRPTSAGIETLYFARASPSALQVAQARGVMLLSLESHGVPFAEYTPSQIKLAVLGRGAGRAEKGQVQEIVRLLLGLKRVPEPYDAADALAIAVCHGNATWSTVTPRGRGRRRAQ